MVNLEMECGPKCRSKQHASQLIRAVTKGNLRQVQLFLYKCHNALSITDSKGRSVLHMAATIGKWEVVDWLISEKKVDMSLRDLESGWTALHRALFYGQLASARLLIAHGCSLLLRDKEGLLPLDVSMKDRLPHVEFVKSGLNKVYTWGTNANFTLGHDSELSRKHPELIESFLKAGISIKQVVLSKYHSVFLSTEGKVYTCGHGRGGRLGHGNEQTCLAPKLVVGIKPSEECVQIAASRDNTVMLMDSGVVYGCGSNDCHQLGYFPPPTNPLTLKPMNRKMLKGKEIEGIHSQRFHTVFYTKDAVFTFGLNAGQLGHYKVVGEPVVSQPRQVSALNQKDVRIKLVAASDASTLVATCKGDVYLLYKYQCRKVINKWLDIVQLAVCGGYLDHRSDTDLLTREGGMELTLMVLSSTGQVNLWRASDPVIKRCAWVIKRQLHITQIALSLYNVAFVTADGEAFLATLPQHKFDKGKDENVLKDGLIGSPPSISPVASVSELVEREEVQDIRIERIPLVHRATGIAADKNGVNFAVLQAQPNANLTEIPNLQSSDNGRQFKILLEEADPMDTIHDCVLQVDNHEIMAHRFILASRSDYFSKIFTSMTDDELAPLVPVIELEKDCYEIAMQMLKFIYTDTCDLLTVGKAFDWSPKNRSPRTDNAILVDHTDHFVEGPGKNISAFAVQRQRKHKKGRKKPVVSEREKSVQSKPDKGNPVKLLQDMAKKYAVKNLSSRLDAVKYVDGTIQLVHGKRHPPPRITFDRSKHTSLYDVCIQSEDGILVRAHKCILVARLEYFKCMLASGWIETSNTEALTLPVPGDILKVFINFLYRDDDTVISKYLEDQEFLCSVLAVSDQLLISRLKEICEVAVASVISLRNACELLEFATLYRAVQLKTTCQQFIGINLAALLETRSLDVLSDEVMEDLTEYYKELVPGMMKRRVTPYEGWPDINYLEALEVEFQDVELQAAQEDFSTIKTKSKKKRNRTRSSGDDQTGRKVERGLGRLISISSDTAVIADPEEEDEPAADSTPEHKDSVKEEIRSAPVQTPPKRDVLHPWGLQHLASPRTIDIPLDTPLELSLPSPGSDAELSSPPPIGLKDIMASQSSLTRSPSAQSSGGKKLHKLSQKERKKLLHSRQADTSKDVVGKVTMGEGAKPKAWTAASNPWGSAKQNVTSFKEVIDKERGQLQGASWPQVAMPTAGGKEALRAAGDRSFNRKGKASLQQSSASRASPRETVWNSPPSRAQSSVSFTDIVQDEIEQTETLQRAVNKPLALIQKEEQAMQDLLVHYRAKQATDEYITVERVPMSLASPTWDATWRH